MKKFLSFLTSLGICFAGYAQTPCESSQPTVLILLGPPGVGKGTHAVSLSKELHLPHISTGDLFREHMRNQTELGKKAKEFVDQGQLVPDSLVIEMLLARLAQKDCANGYILDGFPRTLEQAKALESHLAHAKTTVINLMAKDQLLIDRICGRLMCKNCGTPFHKTFLPPKKEGICDQCQGSLYQREDDKADVVLKRLEIYHLQTAPLIQYYQEKKLLKEIDGSIAKDEVFKSLLSSIPH